MVEQNKIIDADLHVQDPHEIILGYFDTTNDVDFIKGSYKKFKKNIGILVVVLIFMKFFFQEMFVTKLFIFQVIIVSILLASFVIYFLPLFMRLIHHSSNDGIRGILYQIIFISIIVLMIGVFI